MKSMLNLGITLFLKLVIIFITVRIVEYIVVCSNGLIDFSFVMFFERSVNLDAFFIYLWSVGILFLGFCMAFFSNRLAISVLQLLTMALVVVHLMLTLYFLLSNNILMASVFQFSVTELAHIIGNEISFQSISFMLMAVLVLWLSYLFIYKTTNSIRLGKWTERVFAGIYLLLGLVVFGNLKYSTKVIRYFESNYAYLLGNSKETLFVLSFKDESLKFDPSSIALHTAAYRKNHPEFGFSDDAYPLVHSEAYANVLGPFFIRDSTIKPNIVLIISESLSSSFSGKGCFTRHSLTPYIDSLASSGLSWNNFLSNAERSYGVLTNVLASLPTGTGQRGFINMNVALPKGKSLPSHESILKLLREHNYVSSFYYGGWGYYDRVGYYLQEHGIDYFATEDSFNTTRYKRKKGDFSWGYNDKDLFDMSQHLQHNRFKKRPFIDVYQTLSLHSPYNLLTSEYESENYINQRIKQLGLEPHELRNIPMEIIGSIFFSEDALREFINSVKTKKEYENTIFILTGDHGITYPISNQPLERYRVPLVIFSNLLKKTAHFNGYCSHLDITPSILALLNDNFGLPFPAERHWLGAGLDTSLAFRNIKNIPLDVNNESLAQFVSYNYIKYPKYVVQFDSTLKTKEINDTAILNRMNSLFENYCFINNYVCWHDRIWRDKEEIHHKKKVMF